MVLGLNIERSMFDQPEAEKCLLAYGEFDVHLFIFNI